MSINRDPVPRERLHC